MAVCRMTQPEQGVLADLLDAPEVQGAAHGQMLRIPTTSPEAHAADHGVERAPQLPEHVAEVPARVAADATDGAESPGRRDAVADRAAGRTPA